MITLTGQYCHMPCSQSGVAAPPLQQSAPNICRDTGLMTSKEPFFLITFYSYLKGGVLFQLRLTYTART